MTHCKALDTLKAARREGTAATLAALVGAGIDRALPLPGSGHTLERWRVLAEVAAIDLSLIKLFEGHTDALAIRAELGAGASPPGALWGTWCAEPPDARLSARPAGQGGLVLDGVKAWCSGAAELTHAVVSCWNEAGEPCLATVALDQNGIHLDARNWHAVGMEQTGSLDIRFSAARALPLGRPGDYVRRPGFWHGGAGIAACWFGGALGVARRTRELLADGDPDPHRLAHLGSIDIAVAGAAAALRACAAGIDAKPADDARTPALRVRLIVEQAAESVMRHAARALGAGPLCRDARFARAMADLPVYLRQSHAERDLAALGQSVLREESASWTL
ncbi:acyl-CoA dehydrogenase family protein [Variovorax defluvii]|uniref:Acyl-CoA dehydrogenase family protein n=1 Tax=Variovorax defluvii TaxID=913761 RepID=A0ABP8IE51_9BURK